MLGLNDLITESNEFTDHDSYLPAWYPIIQSFVQLYPSLQREMQVLNLTEFGKTCEACGRLLEILDQPTIAYNFYEFAYTAYESCGVEFPRFDVVIFSRCQVNCRGQKLRLPNPGYRPVASVADSPIFTITSFKSQTYIY